MAKCNGLGDLNCQRVGVGGDAGAPKDSFEGRTAVKLKFQLIRGQS